MNELRNLYPCFPILGLKMLSCTDDDLRINVNLLLDKKYQEALA